MSMGNKWCLIVILSSLEWGLSYGEYEKNIKLEISIEVHKLYTGNGKIFRKVEKNNSRILQIWRQI